MKLAVRGLGVAMTSVAVAVVAFRAFEKGMLEEPEWSFWAEAAEAGSAWSDNDLGYLPAFSVLLRPFFSVEPSLGLAVYIGLALACAWGGFHLTWKVSAAADARIAPGYSAWHLLWFSGVFLVSVRNNQVTVQMLLLVVVGLALLMRGRGVVGAAAIACAAWLKPLPLTLGLYFLLKRRWTAAVALGAVTVGGSFLLTAADLGIVESAERHLSWPQRVLALEQTPKDGAEVNSVALGLNQGIAGIIARREAQLGPTTVAVLRAGLFWGSLLVVCWTVTRRRDRVHWDEVALWLAWTAFAAPFGRYYYAVLLVPAWLLLLGHDGRRGFRWWVIAFMPLLSWGGPSMGVFAVTSTATFVLMLERMISTVRSRDLRPSSIESLAPLRGAAARVERRG